MSYSDSEAELYQNYSLLYPLASKELALGDIKSTKLNIRSLALDSIGTRLYSTYLNGKSNSRMDAEIYRELTAALSRSLRLGLYTRTVICGLIFPLISI